MTAGEFYEFVHLPENRDRSFDLVRGEVVELTKPGRDHGFIYANIARILGNFDVQRKKGYVCSNDTGLVVANDPDTVRGSDILFFEDATTRREIGAKFGVVPPLLAIEVLSPSDTHGKVMRRVNDQLHFGTP